MSGEEQNLNTKLLNLEFPYFSNTLCTFWQNSILFQGLEIRFHDSILSVLRGNPDLSFSENAWRGSKKQIV